MVARADIEALVSTVCDPEIPVLSIVDLGILRDIRIEGEAIDIDITPTYTGCPAMAAIRSDIERTLSNAGYGHARVNLVLSPAWTTDWMSAEGRQKLKAYGIAPPVRSASNQRFFGTQQVACPRCDSGRTEKISEFGSTACKAQWRCLNCLEPFDYFKCL